MTELAIHTVSPGQTLYSIAREYGVAPGILARLNGLTEPYRLAVGQSLLILFPEELYTVRAGDTLFSIANRAGLGVTELYQKNPNLGGRPALYPGQVLVLRYRGQPERRALVTGYAYPFADEETLRGILPYATYLAPFTYGFTPAGALVDLEDEALVRLAHRYQAGALLHLSTLTQAGGFSSELAAAVLGDAAARGALEDAAVLQMVRGGFDGVDVDFEYLGAENADAYAAFVSGLRERVRALGGLCIAAAAPKVSRDQAGVLYEGHDYALLGAAADAVLVMTYEWGYTYGPPMAVAPLISVRRVLEFAKTEMPPEKILMGFPNYAYDWTLPYHAGQSRARSIGNEDAVKLAVEVGAEIKYDQTSATPYFHYTKDGAVHEVWFEDARSARAKLSLIAGLGLAGVGVWNFMRPFRQLFSVLQALYVPQKFV